MGRRDKVHHKEGEKWGRILKKIEHTEKIHKLHRTGKKEKKRKSENPFIRITGIEGGLREGKIIVNH
jgi:hypothetical protein